MWCCACFCAVCKFILATLNCPSLSARSSFRALIPSPRGPLHLHPFLIIPTSCVWCCACFCAVCKFILATLNCPSLSARSSFRALILCPRDSNSPRMFAIISSFSLICNGKNYFITQVFCEKHVVPAKAKPDRWADRQSTAKNKHYSCILNLLWLFYLFTVIVLSHAWNFTG